MSDISKEAVDALLQGVTAGPWAAWPHGNDETAEMFWYVSGNNHGIIVEVDEGDDGVVATSIGRTAAMVSANARFIAAARELVPALRAALDEAEARAVKAEAERDAANALLRQIADLTTQHGGAAQALKLIRAHLGAKP